MSRVAKKLHFVTEFAMPNLYSALVTLFLHLFYLNAYNSFYFKNLDNINRFLIKNELLSLVTDED